MPVKLTNGALDEMLLSACNVVARGEICDDLLPDPATLEETRLGVGEAPLHVRHDTIVGRLLAEIVWIL